MLFYGILENRIKKNICSRLFECSNCRWCCRKWSFRKIGLCSHKQLDTFVETKSANIWADYCLLIFTYFLLSRKRDRVRSTFYFPIERTVKNVLLFHNIIFSFESIDPLVNLAKCDVRLVATYIGNPVVKKM